MKLKLFGAAAVVLLLAVKTPVFGGHGPLVGLAAAAVLGMLIWTSLPGGGRDRVLTGHGHGTRKLISRHEGGHAVAAKALGGRVRYAWLTDDSGYVAATLPDSDQTKAVAFLAAGRYAVGTGRGCSADDAAIRKVLREVPSTHRAQVKRDGIRLAKRITSSRAGEIKRYARKLDEKGRL
jgi:hypothetical protein